MNIQLSTPALLFPAVSLLFLSYTNRFLALSSLIRSLHDQWTDGGIKHKNKISAQINNLRKRLKLIKTMQIAGAISLLACVCSMGALIASLEKLGLVCFVIALVLMAYSLCALTLESFISGGALKILLDEAEAEGCQ